MTPDPHPWQPYLPAGWTATRAALETGDFALTALPDGVIIERKTAADLAGCLGQSRERFERELKRSRYAGRFIVICEGSFADLLTAARGIHRNAVIGTLSAWSVRYCPIIFCGDVKTAAETAFRSLAAQVRDVRRQHEAITAEAVTHE